MDLTVALFATAVVAVASLCAWAAIGRIRKAHSKRREDLANKRARYARQTGPSEPLTTAPPPRPKTIFGRR